MRNERLKSNIITNTGLNIVAEYTKEAVIILNEQLQIMIFNSYAEKLFGITVSEIHLQDFDSFCKKVNIKNFIAQFVNQPSAISVDIQPNIGNKNTFWHFSSIKEQHLYLIISQGFSDKSTQNEILKLETLIDNMPCNVYWMDKNCIMSGCNQNVLKMLDLSKEQFRGKSYEELEILCHWPEGLAQRLKTDDLSVLSTGKPIIAKEDPPLPNAQGGEFNFLTSRVPLKNRNGEIVGVAGISTDVTALKEARKKAEAANIAKTEFIANMSHDIRTPLSGIVGLGDIVEKEIENPKHRDMIHDIVKSSYELLNMLNEILDVVSLGGITVDDIHQEPFDLLHLVQTIIDLEKSSIDLKQIELVHTIDTQIPTTLIGDHKKIHHILLNLIGNAIKFTKEGQVSINIKLIEKRADSVRLLFEISDTGLGIPAEYLDRIFELFYKVTPSYKGLDKGHGIGLHIVKTYTELLGGKICVESKMHEGSTFSFNLTLKIPDKDAIHENITHASMIERSEESLIISSAQTIKTTAPLTDIISNAPKVLIIEDNDVVRMITQKLVCTIAKCTPITANDGESGLEFAKKQSFDLILSDIGLPGISGIEFAQQFRQHEKEQNMSPIPIVAITGHAEGAMHNECINAGINDVYTKPLKIEMLTEIFSKFSLFHNKSTQTLSQVTSIKSNSNTGGLGIDLPNTEAELFLTDNFLIFDSESVKKVIGDNNTLLTDMLKLTLTVIAEELPLIKTAHEAHDWERIAKISHKLKGGFLNIGLTRAAIACQYLERYHKAGHNKLLEQLYLSVLKVIDETSKNIKASIK